MLQQGFGTAAALQANKAGLQTTLAEHALWHLRACILAKLTAIAC